MKTTLLELLSSGRYIINSKFILESALHSSMTDWELVFYNDKGVRVVYLTFTTNQVHEVTVNFDTVSAYIKLS